jgi:GNAT superfamily N-acetyltransferase
MRVPLRIARSSLRRPVRAALKFWSVLFSDGTVFSAHPDVEEMDLDRDFPAIERLLAIEQWPFVRADLEVPHSQPRAVSYVARKGGKFAGFYMAHHFGDVGYLDISIVAPEFRGQGVVRVLHARVVQEIKRRGIRSFVVHTTNDSRLLIWMLGFSKGNQTFTILARDPLGEMRGPSVAPATELGSADFEALTALDAKVFGLRRDPWIAAMLKQPTNRFYGIRDGQNLRASLCLRTRQAGAISLDAANAERFEDLEAIVKTLVARHADRHLECIVRDGAELDQLLRSLGFSGPEYFRAIGPFNEWRKGRTGVIGRTPLTQCLSWF